MPACPVRPFRLHLPHRQGSLCIATHIAAARLYATSSVASAAASTSQLPPSDVGNPVQTSNRLQHAHTITALHTSRGILPKILAPGSPEFLFWNGLLKGLSDELSGTTAETHTTEQLRVVVYPVDQYSSADALVGALLEDPFSSEAENERIRRRWEGREADRIEFEYGSPTPSKTKPAEDSQISPLERPSPIYLSSPFLTSLSRPVHLTELRPSSSDRPSVDHLHALYTADIPIIVVNPLTRPLASLFSCTANSDDAPFCPYPLPPHAILLITSPSPTSPPPSLLAHIASLLPSNSHHKILLVDPARAHSAVRSLQSAPSDPLHVQRYSDDAVGSGLSALTQTLKTLFPPSSSSDKRSLQAQKAAAVLRASTSLLHAKLGYASRELRNAMGVVQLLREKVEIVRGEAEMRVFGKPSESSAGGTEALEALGGVNKVHEAMKMADEVVKPVTARLSWWLACLMPDEVIWRIDLTVRHVWITIERVLLPTLAPLPSGQARLAALTHTQLATLPASLYSPVLVNALDQIAHSPTYPLQAVAVLSTIVQRLARLDTGSTPKLARAAHGLLLRVVGSVGSGVAAMVAVGTWGWGFDSEGLGTAVGAGLLVAAAGIRWATGQWHRAREAWSQDWKRVQEGAERDVKDALDKALETQVLVVPVRACEGIEELVAKRRDEIDILKGEVGKIESTMLESKGSS
ncbi:hypothetical protein BV25DRAFT_1821019 [Artomyces pyxidatus]|uniref:Uncharacterized protein n=1 Tax=Artomyces pyxidatus TaxID=48021 RepID=A0ACB8TDB2_9AGAM|nr:hypothetical protein BV25DRAFT_1821019 [Artomyces pyxidatus]